MVKVISHDALECTRARSNDIFKIKKNPDPILHPFQKAREYTRALNAVKLDRLFAKPFIASLAGHIDGVYCMAKHATSLTSILSGSADGELRAWDLSNRYCIFLSLSFRKCIWRTFGHSAFVKGVCYIPDDSSRILSCSDDKTVKLWDISSKSDNCLPLMTFDADCLFSSIDHQRGTNVFVTAGGDSLQVWNTERASLINTYSWGADNVKHVRFNNTEVDIVATTASDRSITLYDLRMRTAISKVILQMKSNSLSWNPMEPYYFTVANEDHNCYTFDMRKLEKSVNILKDHASAV